MSDLTLRDANRPKPWQALIGVAVVVIGLGWYFNWVPNVSHWLHTQQAAVKTVKPTEMLHEQQSYQRGLTHDVQHRVPDNTIVLRGYGQVATVKAAKNANTSVPSCSFRCATVYRLSATSVAVSLPVGYSYQDDDGQMTDDAKRFTFSDDRVLKLTYWDPSTNGPRTITAGTGVGSVTLPAILHQKRVVDLKIGQSGYIENTDAVETASGRAIVFGFARASYMPSNTVFSLGSYDTLITRTENGYMVCAKDGLTIFDPKMASRTHDTDLLSAKITC